MFDLSRISSTAIPTATHKSKQMITLTWEKKNSCHDFWTNDLERLQDQAVELDLTATWSNDSLLTWRTEEVMIVVIEHIWLAVSDRCSNPVRVCVLLQLEHMRIEYVSVHADFRINYSRIPVANLTTRFRRRTVSCISSHQVPSTYLSWSAHSSLSSISTTRRFFILSVLRRSPLAHSRRSSSPDISRSFTFSVTANLRSSVTADLVRSVVARSVRQICCPSITLIIFQTTDQLHIPPAGTQLRLVQPPLHVGQHSKIRLFHPLLLLGHFSRTAIVWISRDVALPAAGLKRSCRFSSQR